MRDIKNKISEIIEGYLLWLGHRFAFIKDDDLTEQINHRQAKCESCCLRNGNWCSRKKVTKAFIDGEAQTVRGCSCYLKAKWFVSYSRNLCPLHKWKK